MPDYKEITAELSAMKSQAHKQAEINQKPKKTEALKSFCYSSYCSIRFILTEKENFLFALLQLAAIGLGYFLWVEGLSWVPEEVWRASDNSDDNTLAGLIICIWSFFCVGVVAYPLGLMTACMGASYILRHQGRESTIAECLKIVMQKAWPLWIFSWLDGWWTVDRILERLPKKNDRTPLSVKLLNEAIYQAWKLASLGFMPAVLCGRGVKDACKDSLALLKNKFVKLAKLRAAYSLICWIFGIGCYVGCIFLFPFLSAHMSSRYDMHSFYFYVGFPLIVTLAFIMLIFRPVYIISAFRIYAEYAREKSIKINLPETTSKVLSSLVTFTVLAIILTVVVLYSEQLGIEDLIRTRIDTIFKA